MRMGSGRCRALQLVAGLSLVAGLAGCSLFSCEDPLERELRQKEEALHSRPVVAYRSIKTALRATPLGEGAKGGPVGDGKVAAKLTAWLSPAQSAEAGDDSLLDYVALGAELKALADKLDELSEDDYPTLLEQLFSAYGQPAPKLEPIGWGNAHEHLLLGLLWTGAKGTPPGLALYELDKVAPAQSDPALIHVLAPLFRALTYMRFAWPHLAEKEWTDYLQALETHRQKLIDGGLLSETPEQDLAWFHILGRLGRAKVRMNLEDDEGAGQDLEAAVAFAEKHGLDSESTWMLGCYVALRADDTDRAATYLAKLEASPSLGEAERELVKDVKVYVNARDPSAGMRKLADDLFAVSALAKYARQTGPVVKLEQGVRASEPGKRMMGLMEEMQQLIDAFSPAKKVRGLLDKATDGVKRVLD